METLIGGTPQTFSFHFTQRGDKFRQCGFNIRQPRMKNTLCIFLSKTETCALSGYSTKPHGAT
jgi:hypothetical protein